MITEDVSLSAADYTLSVMHITMMDILVCLLHSPSLLCVFFLAFRNFCVGI